MSVVGIVSEFDPFHLGHGYLISQAKKQTGAEIAVTVMGGNFTQRGTPSMLSKTAKTEAALLGGIDIVLELPTDFALSSAERFALGAVKILSSCGIVTHIAFGSECGDLATLNEVAKAVTSEKTLNRIKELMKDGVSFAAARKIAVGEKIGDKSEILSNPNDILAVEYIKALQKLAGSIIPLPIKRIGAGHDGSDVQNGIASASLIRERIKNGQDITALVPPHTADIIKREKSNGNLRFASDRTVLTLLRRLSPQDFALLPEVREGLENRLYKAALTATSLDEFVHSSSCRRYTESSIRRIAMYALLNIKKSDLKAEPDYVRILGASEKGTEYLRTVKEKTMLPLITKGADSAGLLQSELYASRIAAVFAQRLSKGDEEFTSLPIFTKYLTESENKS